MGVTDFGTQTISFNYNEPGKSENFNKLNYKILETGIYEGGLLTYVDPTHINVAPLVAYLQDTTTGVSIRVETADSINLLVASSAPYCVLRFDWANVTNNFVDVIMVADGDLDADDLILGRTIYDVTTLETFFDYSRKHIPTIVTGIAQKSEFLVLPQEPYDKTVSIQGGIINNGSESIAVATGDSPTISDTTLGRTDIVYMTGTGAFGVIEGVDSGSPITPEYGTGYVLCEIHRGANKTYITGADIIMVTDDKFAMDNLLRTEVTNIDIGPGGVDFVPRTFPVSTPISEALQTITDDMRTGEGMQDDAILDRHLSTEVQDVLEYPYEWYKDYPLDKVVKINDGKYKSKISNNEAPPEIDDIVTQDHPYYRNIMVDPSDLTTGSWTPVNAVRTLSEFLTSNGNTYTKIENSIASLGHTAQESQPTHTSLSVRGSVSIKQGVTTNNETLFIVNNTTTTIDIFSLVIDFDNYPNSPGTPTFGTLESYKWVSSDELTIYYKCDDLTSVNDNAYLKCGASTNAVAGEHTYYSEAQLYADPITDAVPYIDGEHIANDNNYPVTLGNQVSFDTIIEPTFAFDTEINKTVYTFYESYEQNLTVEYDFISDKFRVVWYDGTTERYLYSQQFDDGTTYVDINQRLRLIGSLHLSSGGINDSRFIVLPLETGSINEDTAWSGTPDVKSSTFDTLKLTGKYSLISRGVIARDDIRALTFGNDLYVVGDYDGYIYTSPDGADWTDQGIVATSIIYALTFGNNVYVAGSADDHIYTSPDGITWDDRGQPGTNTGIYSLAFGDNIFVAGSQDFHIYTAIDPTGTWTDQGAIASDDISAITYGNNIFVAVSLDYHIYTATDPTGTWTDQGVISASSQFQSVTFGNNLFLAGDSSGHIFTSPDGTTWTDRGAVATLSVNALSFGNNIFVANSSDGYTYTSSDGIEWKVLGDASPDYARGITFGNGLFVMGTHEFRIDTWNSDISHAYSKYEYFRFFNGLLVGAITDETTADTIMKTVGAPLFNTYKEDPLLNWKSYPENLESTFETIRVSAINEKTPDSGVIVEGVLLKDGKIDAGGGLVNLIPPINDFIAATRNVTLSSLIIGQVSTSYLKHTSGGTLSVFLPAGGTYDWNYIRHTNGSHSSGIFFMDMGFGTAGGTSITVVAASSATTVAVKRLT